MAHVNWRLAESIALELVNRETDVNEVQKVASHVRVSAERQPEKTGEQFFGLLGTMVRDGRYLVRSGRTLDYYRDLREVCLRYLSEFQQTTPEKAWELVATLGWTARLLRYYTSDEGSSELAAKQRSGEGWRTAGTQAVPSSGPAQKHSVADPASRASKPLQFSKPVSKPTPTTDRELVTLIAAASGGKARVRTTQGEEMICTGIPLYPVAAEGDVCQANVVRLKGKAVKATFKVWRS